MVKVAPKNILLNTKIAVGIMLAILLVLAGALFAQGFIETHDYRERITKAIEEQTHRKVLIKGAVTVSLLPVPTLYIPSMELRDPNSDQPTPSASVELVSIRVNALTIFSDHPKIFSITLNHPVLELVRAEDNLVHWDWLNPELFKALVANVEGDDNLALQVQNGVIVYHDNNSDTSFAVENINAKFINNSEFKGGGDFTCLGHHLDFTLNRGIIDVAKSTAPVDMKFTSGSDFIEMKGDVNVSGALPEIHGKLALDLADAMIWTKPKQQQDAKLFDVITKQMVSKKRGQISLPLKIESDWSEKGLTVHMDNMKIDGLNSTGSGSLELTWRDWQPGISTDLLFSSLDLERWKKSVYSLFSARGQNIYSQPYHAGDETHQNQLTQNIDFTLNLVAEKVLMGNQTWNNATLSAIFADSAITVNQFSIQLPGESSLSLFGVMTASSTNDLRFEGSMETKGQSLRQLLTVFDESASGLPETGLGDFSARSNVFISSEQLRLSDADVKLADLHLNGGLVAYFDTNVRLEAEVQLKNINFDYFRNIWRDRQQKVREENFFLKFNRAGVDFGWLKKLQPTIDFRIGVEHFTFLDRSGDSASFRLYARGGELGIYDINFVYPTDIMKGSFRLNVNGEQPQIDLGLSMSSLDTSYFNVDPFKRVVPPASDPAAPTSQSPQSQLQRSPASKILLADARTGHGVGEYQLEIEPQSETVIVPPKQATTVYDYVKKTKAVEAPLENGAGRFSQELWDMSWMVGLAGNVNLNVGRLYHKNLQLDNVRLMTKFSNNVMAFNTLSFTYWGGECNVTGSLYGGKVPAIVVNFSLANMSFHDMMMDLAGRDNLTGSISVNASMNTSGVNMLSWINQLEGKVVVVGRGIQVNGLNLPGVVDAVTISRTPSDVVNSVNSRLVDGSTVMSIDGNINIKNGILRTPGFALKSGAIVGDLVGEVNLLSWRMDTTTLFQFPELSSETIPTMSLQLYGPLKNGELRTDTASLEAFVAKRIISK